MKVALFDLDGTLASNEHLKARAISEACLAYGAVVDPLVYAECVGADWRTVTDQFFNTCGIRQPLSNFKKP